MELFSIGTPSTTYSGWLLPDSELKPRMTTEFEAPGSAAPVLICTPATLPARADMTSLVRLSEILSPSTAVAEKPRAFVWRLMPMAVTTTSSSELASRPRRTVMPSWALTACVRMPT